jgi:propanediol dehydratase medium subunit
MARPRWQAKAALLHLKEFDAIAPDAGPVEVDAEFTVAPA